MSDLIDKSKLLAAIPHTDLDEKDCKVSRAGAVIDMVFLISEQPTVDAVPVVRCKDCKHCYEDGDNVVHNCCELNHGKAMPDDWFCADGKPKGVSE